MRRFGGAEFWQNMRKAETKRREEKYADFKVETYNDLEFQTFTDEGGKLLMVVYKGKSGKPISRYYYGTLQRRDAEMDRLKRGADARMKYKKDREEARKNIKNVFKVGDILYASWGYEQTNIDFYKVVGLTAKSVKIVKIGQKRTDDETGHWLSEYVVADPTSEEGHVMTKRVGGSKEHPSVKVRSFAWAHKWGGNPVFQSHWH